MTSQRWHALALLAVVLPTAAWVFWQSQRLFRADWASIAERPQVVAWAAGKSRPKSDDEWQAAHDAIAKSLSITPDDPDMQERMGDVHLVAGQRDWADAATRPVHHGRAAAYYRKAIELRPGEPQTWAMLATALQAIGPENGADIASVHAAWAQALKLGPYEGHVQPILMQLVLADWSNATPAMQDWAKKQFDDGTEATRKAINAMAAPYGLMFEPDAPAKP